MTPGDFRHKVGLRVRNYEVDWLGIVHNAQYLLYFEVGRIDYLKTIGVKIEYGSIQKESKVVLVRNEINYRSPARFDDALEVRTRISSIGRTSFTFEGLMTEAATGRLIAENVAVHVWLDPLSEAPSRVGDEFRRKVVAFEGEGRVANLFRNEDE